MIPRCCRAHRLEALDAIGRLFALDGLALGDDLAEAGWKPEAIPDAIRQLGEYLSARIIEAVGIAVDGWTPNGPDTPPPRSSLGAHRPHRTVQGGQAPLASDYPDGAS